MSIVSTIAAFEASEALARRAFPGPVRVVETVDDDLLSIAEEQHADLIVVAAGAGAVDRLLDRADLPVLVLRDPRPFHAWASGDAPLRALLGWDETETTSAALEPVAALRRAGGVELSVVHVYYPDDAARRYGMRVESLVDASPELEALLRRDIEREIDGLVGDGVTVTPVRGLGHIGDHLLEAAEARGADLIVLGTHHRAGVRRLSSVVARVLGDLGRSVLLVPLRPGAAHHAVRGFQTALVATDGSAFANYAVPYAYRLVAGAGEVHVVRVVPPEWVEDRSMAQALLELAPRQDRGIKTVAHVVRDRDAAHAISVTAERVGADVVCIASHGRAGFARVVAGSVTDRLLHVCRRPVLVLHPRE